MSHNIFSDLNRSVFDQKNDFSYLKDANKGLSIELIKQISQDKNEPSWMLDFRLQSLQVFYNMPMPTWGPDLSDLNLAEICYYAKATDIKANNWEDVPNDIKNTFEQLGIPEAERKILAGAGVQYESENVYHALKDEWQKKGVIFLDLDQAIKDYPNLVQTYFMQCIKNTDHKFSALHGAVWSGGTFLYVPANIHIDDPLQSYFRMNAPAMGQFEHTLIIIEDGAKAHYIEGCSAPKYDQRSLHVGGVEIFVKANAQFRYSSVENWSKDTYNLNTKKAIVEANARMEWVSGNMGSGITMLYPCSVLVGAKATTDHLSIAVANQGQNQDIGAKVIHLASNTSSNIISKGIALNGGINTYRGLIKVAPNATNCTAKTECNALILDELSQSNAYPQIDIANNEVTISHEAFVGKINPEDIFYLMSRGLNEEEAKAIIVTGFLDAITKEMPLEYAVEINRLIELEMER